MMPIHTAETAPTSWECNMKNNGGPKSGISMVPNSTGVGFQEPYGGIHFWMLLLLQVAGSLDERPRYFSVGFFFLSSQPKSFKNPLCELFPYQRGWSSTQLIGGLYTHYKDFRHFSGGMTLSPPRKFRPWHWLRVHPGLVWIAFPQPSARSWVRLELCTATSVGICLK